MTFKINGADFSHLVSKYGYATGKKPVIAKSVTDLSGVTREVVRRWRSTLSVTLNPLTSKQAKEISGELARQGVTVTYFDIQKGCDVTEKMKCVEIEHSVAISGRYWAANTLSFEQR